MKRLRVRADGLDKTIARAIARGTGARTEFVAQVITRVADEKIVMPVALGTSLLVMLTSQRPAVRAQARHLIAVLLAASAADHLAKWAFVEERPDRVEGHIRGKGVPRSGGGEDAFPSGHAMLLGVLAAALSRFHHKAAPYLWGAAILIGGTRIVLLAHWFTDVVLGFLVGAGVEKGLWAATGRLRKRGT